MATLTATIAPGTALSASVAIGGQTLARLDLPAAGWDPANLTFQVSQDNVTFEDLYDTTGKIYTLPAAAGHTVALNPAVFQGFAYLIVRSGPPGAPVNQTASRTLTLTTVPAPGGTTPGAIVAHRTVTAADGTTKPGPAAGTWAVNPGGKQKCRVFCTPTGTVTGGTYTARPYLRSGGATGLVGMGTAQNANPGPNYDCFFDVQADGDDVQIYIETFSLTGTTPGVSVSLSWR